MARASSVDSPPAMARAAGGHDAEIDELDGRADDGAGDRVTEDDAHQKSADHGTVYGVIAYAEHKRATTQKVKAAAEKRLE